MRGSPVLVLALGATAFAACDAEAPAGAEPTTAPPLELVLGSGQSLVAGELHTCARLSNGTVRCWGDNSLGQLGRGARWGLTMDQPGDPLADPVTLRTHMVDLGSRRTAKAIFAGPQNTCAILDTDQLKCWGDNADGQLGQQDTISRGRDEELDPQMGGMGDSLPPVNVGTGRTVKSVAVGATHVCAILDSNQVKCWGRSYQGSLGYAESGTNRGGTPGTMGDNLPVVDLGTGRTAKAIAATGYLTTCAILDDNRVKCWGINQNCTLGIGDGTVMNLGNSPGSMGDNLPYVNIGVGRTAVAITAGNEFFCVLRDNGTVKCWGWNTSGQIGIGSGAPAWGCSPSEMGDFGIVSLGGNDAVAISAGKEHACALRATGSEVRCWGSNSDKRVVPPVITGQLGINAGTIPTQLTAPSAPLSFGAGVTARALAAGGWHTCMISTANKAKCWGLNANNQLGTNITVDAVADVPGEMGGNLLYSDLTSRPVTQVASGWYHHCAILSGGAMKCWGLNIDGALGVGDANNRGDGPGEMGANLPALALGAGRTAKSMGLGAYHSCAALDNNLLKCWGSNWEGQLGYNDTTLRLAPSSSTIILGTGLTVHTTAVNPVSGGSAHTCALLSNNQVKCWGFNAEGQLGYGDTTNRLAPDTATVNLGFGRSAKAVAAGNQHTCAILDTNQVKCWGANWNGQLGYGDTTNRLSPPASTVSLGSGRTAKAISTRYDTTCVWLDTNQLKCWGANFAGQAGVGNTTNQLAPPSASVNLGTSQSALAVSVGEAHVCALLATNQVKCWGNNTDYQCGTWQDDSLIGDAANELGDYLATVFQGGGRHVKALSAGAQSTCFLLDTDQVRCTGLNSSGELGVGDTNTYAPQNRGAGIVDLGPDP
jgi:alpha-tubulin suppressor-like RCC1 family protein